MRLMMYKHLQSHLSFAYYLKKSETDANYSTIFSCWDKIFKSKSNFERQIKMPIGVEGDHEQSLLRLILRPFTK